MDLVNRSLKRSSASVNLANTNKHIKTQEEETTAVTTPPTEQTEVLASGIVGLTKSLPSPTSPYSQSAPLYLQGLSVSSSGVVLVGDERDEIILQFEKNYGLGWKDGGSKRCDVNFPLEKPYIYKLRAFWHMMHWLFDKGLAKLRVRLSNKTQALTLDQYEIVLVNHSFDEWVIKFEDQVFQQPEFLNHIVSRLPKDWLRIWQEKVKAPTFHITDVLDVCIENPDWPQNMWFYVSELRNIATWKMNTVSAKSLPSVWVSNLSQTLLSSPMVNVIYAMGCYNPMWSPESLVRLLNDAQANNTALQTELLQNLRCEVAALSSLLFKINNPTPL